MLRDGDRLESHPSSEQRPPVRCQAWWKRVDRLANRPLDRLLPVRHRSGVNRLAGAHHPDLVAIGPERAHEGLSIRNKEALEGREMARDDQIELEELAA